MTNGIEHHIQVQDRWPLFAGTVWAGELIAYKSEFLVKPSFQPQSYFTSNKEVLQETDVVSRCLTGSSVRVGVSVMPREAPCCFRLCLLTLFYLQNADYFARVQKLRNWSVSTQLGRSKTETFIKAHVWLSFSMISEAWKLKEAAFDSVSLFKWCFGSQ